MGKLKYKKYLESGESYGEWVVLYPDVEYNTNRTFSHWKYVCKCSCEKGTIKSVARMDLLLGKSISCGCSRVGVKRGVSPIKGRVIPNEIIEDNKCIKILFTDRSKNLTGKYAIIDKEDYKLIKMHRWFITSSASSHTFYAEAHYNGCKIKLHRLITEAIEGFDVDHINGDGLDNRRINLRIVTRSENCMNRKLQSNNTSGSTGVVFSEDHQKWRASIVIDGKRIDLGIFFSKENAIKRRKKAEERYFGKFSYDNSRGEHEI